MRIPKKYIHYILYFLFYSHCGWVYEVLLGIAHGRGFINRGYLFGPWLPVYGFGALMILPFMKMKRYGMLPVFLSSTAFATLIELIASYVMEWINGTWLWNYQKDLFNFEGRIALWPSIRFGILIIIMLYLVHPFIKKMIRKAEWKLVKTGLTIACICFAADSIARLFLGSNLKDAALF